MALRSLYFVLALGLLITSGCKTSSNYRAPCPPAVVATVPVQPVCPPGQCPPPQPVPIPVR
jgi:hypothetical protein